MTMKAFMKRWGLHHGLLTLLLVPFVGWFITVLFFGKEFGEAIERARGTYNAVTTWTVKTADNPKGIWEPWDALTPLIVNLIYWGLVTWT